MSDYKVINILDMLQAIGEDTLSDILSDFSCAKNPEIETFVKFKAIEFAKQKLSITYLVLDDDGQVVGIFTLTHKALQVCCGGMSKTTRKKLERYAILDETTDTYTLSAFLIAQFGKNDLYRESIPFSGKELMCYTMATLADIQWKIGGGIVYLECEDHPKLLSFYNEKNHFKLFGERYSKNDGTKYLQLLKIF